MQKFSENFVLVASTTFGTKEFLRELFYSFASACTVKDFTLAIWENIEEIAVTLAFTVVARLAAIWLTAAKKVIDFASIIWTVYQLVKQVNQLHEDCSDYFFPSSQFSLNQCDNSDACLVAKVLDEQGRPLSSCILVEKRCPPFTSCDKRDGLCKEDDDIIPCVAVINEDSSFGNPSQEELWGRFRDVYPSRPFCLLIPDEEERVHIPQAFRDDPYTLIVPNIKLDHGNEAYASNWTEKCGLQDYEGTSNSVGFVGLFVDDSGSMYKSEVLASYENFLQDMAHRSIFVKEVVNGNENWILPFLETLVPTTECVTRSGDQGTCMTVTECNRMEGTSVFSGLATDPEPKCRSFPTNKQCCVPKQGNIVPPSKCVTRNGDQGTCMSVTECNRTEGTSVFSGLATDPEPKCSLFPSNGQCCVPKQDNSVPPPDCVTGNGDNGTCITVTECNMKEGTSVPWVATDPEPNCRLLPPEVQCCVLKPPPDCVTGNGDIGTCITVTQCNLKEGTSVPWVATDPEPNCSLLPPNVQCCVPKPNSIFIL